MSKQDESTRRQILELLKRRGDLTVGELAEDIGITTMGVRQHVTSLERDDLVESVVVRQKRGRPTYRFRLTPSADHIFPSRYGQLAVSLLDQVAEIDGPEKVDQLFEHRMVALEGQYNEEMAGLSPGDQVETLARIRDDEGYMAEVDTSSEEDAFILVEHHCPIYEIAKRYPQACHYEQELFRRTLNADVQRTEHKIVGDGRCRYLVRKKQ